MNYLILLARLIFGAYAAFLLLFAFGENITGEGLQHVVLPVLIAMILVFLQNKSVWSAIATMLLFIVTLWFFETYRQVITFLILSLPLLIVSTLFLLGSLRKFNSDIK